MTCRFLLDARLGLLAVSLSTLAACSDDGVTSEDDFGEVGEDGYEVGAGDEGLSGGDSGGGGGGTDEGDTEPGQLTAGEWRDLDNWSFWRGLFAQGSTWADYDSMWGFETSLRIPVLVQTNDEPIADVAVSLRDAQGVVLWRARTDNLGRAETWPAMFGAEVAAPLTLEAGSVELELALPEAPVSDPFLLNLDSAPAEPNNLDLMFVIDTTGSMDDEITYLQAELGDVISRVSQDLGGLDLRIGMSFYKDVGDEYVVQSYPFTTNIEDALGQLDSHGAGGGGDYPEALVEALDDAVFGHEWSSSARARLMFLVLDAPPHDSAVNRTSMVESVQEAAEQGIRIIPLAASGVDKPTEFLLRDFDIATGGTYTFLTSHSGIGGEHLEPTVGEYQVELLNDLLVRLIVESME
jgi:hypothetical protein